MDNYDHFDIVYRHGGAMRDAAHQFVAAAGERKKMGENLNSCEVPR